MSNGRRCAGGDRGNREDRAGARSRSYGRRSQLENDGYTTGLRRGVIRVPSTDDARAAVRPYQVPTLAGTHAGDACGTTKARSPGTRFPSVPGRSFQRVLVTPPSAGSSDDLPNPLTRNHARARLFAKPRFIESGREPETLHKKAAIDAELGAGDVVAVLRAEIHAGPRHFLRLREPLHWDLV
jgi:hypothetical protein